MLDAAPTTALPVPDGGTDAAWRETSMLYFRAAVERLYWQDIAVMHSRVANCGDISPQCVFGLSAMAVFRRGAFSGVQSWRDYAAVRSRAAIRGSFFASCVPEGASDGKSAPSWQHIAAMHPKRAGFGKICAPCIRKAPQSAVEECTARISCRQGALSPSEALRSCTAHESCRPPVALPLRRVSCPSSRITGSPFNGLALAQGCLPQRSADARHLPIPATCQCLPLAAPIAARDKPPMSFGGGHPAHGLQSGQAPRDRRLRHLDGRADNGMLRRTGPGFQNREQAGAEPQAEAAGWARPAAALPKTPIERTSPS